MPQDSKTTLSSMTGFARSEGVYGERRWVWELKSVNGRGLEIRFRLAPGFDDIEPKLRTHVREKIFRGNLNVALSFQAGPSDARYRINEKALDEVIAATKNIQAAITCAPPRADGLLALRGVIEQVEDEQSGEERAAMVSVLVESFAQGVASLSNARKSEGAHMAGVISNHFDEIERLLKRAVKSAGDASEAFRTKLERQLNELLSGAPIAEERLAQEAALLAVRADIREELDRLGSHLSAGRALLGQAGPAGRQLEFLTQEFNREANTICSKAPDMATKQIGLELKKAIDQLREQIQNIE